MIRLERAAGGGATATLAVTEPPAQLCERFAERQSVVVAGLMGPRLLDWVRYEIARTPFHEREEPGLVSELTLDTRSALVARLNFLVNDPAVYRAVEAITGVERLARFDGRIYRRLARPEHYNAWHDDVAGPARLVAMSVNIGSAPYEGGSLALRRKGDQGLLAELQNSGPGDALLFRIRADLQHRVTTVTAGEKTTFVGWFGSAPAWPRPLARATR